jgi:tRNA/rRNA methyltransferase
MIHWSEANEKSLGSIVGIGYFALNKMTALVRKPANPGDQFVVILARPQSVENIGLVARAMKNTGFHGLRVVGRSKVEIACPRTAVHAKNILKDASFCSEISGATADLNVVFASTAKPRQNFSVLPFDEAVSKMLSFPPESRIGLLFGNERTGLTSAELAASNFRWTIPQASRQPSYNLAAAALITLFELFRRSAPAYVISSANDTPSCEKRPKGVRRVRFPGDIDLGPPRSEEGKTRLFPLFHGTGNAPAPLPRVEQEDCIRLIIRKLEDRGFIHPTNKRHTAEMLHDLLGRLAMTDRDRRLLLAVFS